MSANVSEFIQHYGKKGMRWGVRTRKARNTDRTTFSKAPHRLTNTELESRIKRMEMEKRYNDLNKRDVSKGSQIASEVLTNSGKKVAVTVLTGAGLLAVRQVAKKKLGAEAAAMITKRGK